MSRTKYEVPDRPFITTDYMRKRYGKFDPNVFRRWEEAGKIEKVKNGLYLNDNFELRGDLDRFVIAGKIHHPSYVSLQSALFYYNIIPEYVFDVTSITTKKTDSLCFRRADYYFRFIKKELFFGYRSYDWRGEQYCIASPEKALLDLAYFEPLFSDYDWLEEMRFDEDELNKLEWGEMLWYVHLMNSKTIGNRITRLLEVYGI